MMPHDTHPTDLLPAYALGCLDADERAQVEAHIAICATCQAELETLRSVVGELGMTCEGCAPPADLKRRLMLQVRRRDGHHAGNGEA